MSEYEDRLNVIREGLQAALILDLLDVQDRGESEILDDETGESLLKSDFRAAWVAIDKVKGYSLALPELEKVKPIVINTLRTLFSPEGDYYRFRTARHFVDVLMDEVEHLSIIERGAVISSLLFEIGRVRATGLVIQSMPHEEWMLVNDWLWSSLFVFDTSLMGRAMFPPIPPRKKPGPKKQITEHHQLFVSGGIHRLRSFLLHLDCLADNGHGSDSLVVSDYLKGWVGSPFSRSSPLQLVQAIYLLLREKNLLARGHRASEAMEILCHKFSVDPRGRKISDFSPPASKTKPEYTDSSDAPLKGHTTREQQKDLLMRLWEEWETWSKRD